MQPQQIHPENRMRLERVLYEVKKIIVGQDNLLERLVVAQNRRIERLTKPGEDRALVEPFRPAGRIQG